MFKKSTEYQEIKKECIINGTYDKELNFSCYHDSVLVFTQRINNFMIQEISVITDNEIINDDKLKDIMNDEKVRFFHHRIYGQDDYLVDERIWSLPENVLDNN